MQTYMVLAPAVAPLLEYEPDGTLSAVTTKLCKELEMFFEGLMKKLCLNSYIFKHRTHLLR
jgi:hypothetical protein